MNKDEIEKMFDENFSYIETHTTFLSEQDDIKTYIFDTIIPEVLKSVMDDEVKNICSKETNPILHWCDLWWNYVLQNIKQKAKEKYWIDL